MGGAASAAQALIGLHVAKEGIGELTGAKDAEEEMKKQREEQQRLAAEANQLYIERNAAQNKALTDALKGDSKIGAQQRKRASAGTGRSDTIKTGPKGLGEIGSENLDKKTLLGY